MQHHAFLVFASSYEAIPDSVLETPTSCEVTRQEADQLSIAEVRQLQESVALFPTAATVRRFVIEANGIATQAQHALLKLLEEPVSSTQFVLVLRQQAPLLDTIYSRVAFLGRFDTAHSEADVSAFLSGSYQERLSLIGEWAKRYKSQQLRTVIQSVVREAVSSQNLPQQALLSDNVIYSQSSGASLKMLLEEVALTVPVEKR